MNRLVEMRGLYGAAAGFGTSAKCSAGYGDGYGAGYGDGCNATSGYSMGYGANPGSAAGRDKGYGAHADCNSRSSRSTNASFAMTSSYAADAGLGASANIGVQASHANSGSANFDSADSAASRYYPSNNPRYKHQRRSKTASNCGGRSNGNSCSNISNISCGNGSIHTLTLKAIMLLCGVLGAVLAIAFVLHISTDVLGILPAGAGTTASGEVQGASGAGGTNLINKSPQSTPVGEWRKGSVPYLYQTDKQWADRNYADGEIATYGCGPTCLSMVYIDLTGRRDRSPVEMAEFSEKNGYIDGGITSWLLMSEGSGLLGLHAKEVGADANQIRLELSKGHPIICSVGAGDFTTSGHFIVLAGVADGGNKVEIRDPNSYERSQEAWDLDRIIPQCRNIWAFSA